MVMSSAYVVTWMSRGGVGRSDRSTHPPVNWLLSPYYVHDY